MSVLGTVPIEMEYWPELNFDGRSAWRIARPDNKPVKFPRMYILKSAFERAAANGAKLSVIRRESNYLLVLIPAQLPRRRRLAFLNEIARRAR